MCEYPLVFFFFSYFTHVYPQFTYMIFIYSYSYIFTIIGYMTNSQLTIYPCGLIAQWIEHCTGIARSWVRIPFKPEFFSGCFFNCLSWKHTARITISLMFYPQFTYMIFIYSYSYIFLYVYKKFKMLIDLFQHGMTYRSTFVQQPLQHVLIKT